MTRRRAGVGAVAFTAVCALAVAAWFVRPPEPKAVVAAHTGGPVGATPSQCAGATRTTFIASGAERVRVELHGAMGTNGRSPLVGAGETDDASTVGDLIRLLNALPPFPCAIYCPEDDGSLYRMDFDYPEGYTVTARLSVKGCEGLTLGDLPTPVAYAMTSFPNVYAVLNAIVPRPNP